MLWAGNGRSSATAERAASAAMTDVEHLGALCERSDVVVSICPPAAAETVATEVLATGFDGIYVDANAISPATSLRIRDKFKHYIDGSVIGPPAISAGTTRMYLAGPGATDLSTVWSDGPLDAVAIAESADTAAASALKMAYAGWTKGQGALLLAVNALAQHAGVLDTLVQEWELSQPGLAERSRRLAPILGAKAWRFDGEMTEIAAAMDDAGLEPGFHLAASNLYRRMAGFKHGPPPTLDDVLAAVLADGD